MAALKIFCALVLCVLVVEPMVTTAITCLDVKNKMKPCIKYLQNREALPGKCCAGVRALNKQAKTTPNRRTACKCLLSEARSIHPRDDLAVNLPAKCGVNIGVKPSYSINCNTLT
ncbi:hypothetical protein PTKIN_Ptkin06aG0181200 [Pterospermum kingtungense]